MGGHGEILKIAKIAGSTSLPNILQSALKCWVMSLHLAYSLALAKLSMFDLSSVKVKIGSYRAYFMSDLKSSVK